MEQFKGFEKLKKMEWNGMGEMGETNKGLMMLYWDQESYKKI